jgi:hypothetical protein
MESSYLFLFNEPDNESSSLKSSPEQGNQPAVQQIFWEDKETVTDGAPIFFKIEIYCMISTPKCMLQSNNHV